MKRHRYAYYAADTAPAFVDKKQRRVRHRCAVGQPDAGLGVTVVREARSIAKMLYASLPSVLLSIRCSVRFKYWVAYSRLLPVILYLDSFSRPLPVRRLLPDFAASVHRFLRIGCFSFGFSGLFCSLQILDGLLPVLAGIVVGRLLPAFAGRIPPSCCSSLLQVVYSAACSRLSR